MSMSSFRYWIYLFSTFDIILYVSGRPEDLWCLQCSWDAQNTHSSGNNTNSTLDSSCQIDDLDDITLYPPNPNSPTVNPVCYYSTKKDSYDDLLEGPCYDYACYAESTKSCVKWSMYSNGKLINETRLCAEANKKGCYHENQDGVHIEVCVCDDRHYCNGGWSLIRKPMTDVWRYAALFIVVLCWELLW